MTITINGHTLPVEDMDEANAIYAKAALIDTLNGPDSDALYRWIYAGAPLDI